LPMVGGREFRSNDAGRTVNVAIVNQAFAQSIFGTENPIGQSVEGGGITYQIIGVVGNIKSRTLGEETRPVLFRALDQTVAYDPAFMGYSVLVRSAGNPTELVAAVRSQIHSLDPGLPVYNVESMQEHLRDAFFLPRLAATLFGVFGAIGLILAAVGLYGVMSYSVSRRTREIGIRMALGAQVGQVQQLIVREGIALAAAGLAFGLLGAYFIGHAMQSMLYGVAALDFTAFSAVACLLLAAALAACIVPARRAASTDPMQVLRME